MQIHNLSDKNSVLNNFIYELRDISIQKDMMRFRRNIERIGEILSYEMSKTFDFTLKKTETPLGFCDIDLVENNLVVCSILRAGLPLHIGVLNVFDKAENAFISAYRHHLENSSEFEIKVEYAACPSLENKTLVLVDPMLATGQSLVSTFEALKAYGNPKQIHIISVIGAESGVSLIKNKFPENTHLWIATIDKELNNKGYIIPGLGDAGDLAFGIKLQH